MRAQAVLSAVRLIYARSGRFIRGEIDLCALVLFYPRRDCFMRAQVGLSAERLFYARSGWFIRGEIDLCALRLFYPRRSEFIRAEMNICAFRLDYHVVYFGKKNYARQSVFLFITTSPSGSVMI